MKITLKNPFLCIVCPKCKKRKLVFSRATTQVKCDKCKYLLNKNTGGKTRIRAKVSRILKRIWK